MSDKPWKNGVDKVEDTWLQTKTVTPLGWRGTFGKRINVMPQF